MSAPDHRRSRGLIIVARRPSPGRVKTRLGSILGEVRTSELYEAFLVDTIHTGQRIGNCTLCVSFTPARSVDYFRAIAPDAILLAQPDAPFGERLRSAFDGAFAHGFDSVVLIGSDTPHFGHEGISAAFDVLDTEPGVIGPCDDGGWYLLGLHSPEAALFEEGIEWSTERVLQQTLERGRAVGLELARLPRQFDIDEIDDLQRLEVLLGDAPADRCPLTRRMLEKLGGL